ncbi:MAG: tetratricopeptide repeat protein, partial [Bacteroidota bacterium]
MIAKRFLGNFTTIFLILFIFSCFDSIDAQFYAPQIKKSEFLIGENKEGLSEAWKAIKKGDKYFDEGDGYLKLAREHYLKAYNYNKTNAALNYKIGICYLFVDNQSEALKYLRKAYEFDPEITRDIHFMMGRAHHLMMQFDRAIDEYETYRKNLTDKEKKKGWFIDVEKYIDECMNGKELMKEPSRVIINQVGKEINSGADEYNFVISPGDTSAFFTSRRPLYKKSDIARWDNKYFENILVSKKNGKKWGPASSVGKKINKNDRHNAIIAVSDDMKKMYIYDGRKGRGDILVSEFK